MKENYVARFDNVECVVAFVNAPKDPKKGYSYALNIKSVMPELKPYLDPKYNSIYMYSYDQTPRFHQKQVITIAKLGITEWTDSEDKIRYSAHAIHDEKFQGTKKEPKSEPKVAATVTTTQNGEMTKKDWEEKEKRDFRGRCLMYAQACFTPRNSEDGQTELERADQIIMVAEVKFFEYIYNGYEVKAPF